MDDKHFCGLVQVFGAQVADCADTRIDYGSAASRVSLPDHIERHVFVEARLTADRMRDAA